MALLLDCQRQAQERGKTLRVTGAPAKLGKLGKLGKLAWLYGVAELLGLQPGAA